ncbi:IclR family transcriptional regulator [Kribbella antibiotica]|uniref:IclR family transcriptional regulator n=1 Tax=Kribbella antibiotica TaxID=190195 RepID=A0A4R4YID3_9ACTN|nr:IclR family transcriptional regulator [Kribbella antibiotica]TDD44661.1 IclR family transcriptional regulator [Kribbella antibiotica]
MAGRVSTPGATVVSRALALLFAFDEQHRRLTLSELAARADLPLPTAHRLVGELVAGGALAKRSDGAYVVSRKLWTVGLLAPLPSGLRETAGPFLNDIHAATRATVHLAIREGIRTLYLERLTGRASVPVVSTVGSYLPLHSTGVGKVLLAYAPADVQEAALAQLTRFTPHTITHAGRLEKQLIEIRERGYATTTEEMTLGACSVAVPIRPLGPDGPVVAAVGLVVPNLRSHRAALLAALQVAAQGIGRSITA